MQTITIIGRIIGKSTVREQSGRTTLTFTVRAENSPRDKARSTFDFEVVTSGAANRDKLSAGPIELIVDPKLSGANRNSTTMTAGDTFLGYFLTQALDHKSLTDALSLATAASSLCVQVMGASDSVPLRKDVEQAILDGALGKLGEWGGWR